MHVRHFFGFYGIDSRVETLFFPEKLPVDLPVNRFSQEALPAPRYDALMTHLHFQLPLNGNCDGI